jgi:hypothetical protein
VSRSGKFAGTGRSRVAVVWEEIEKERARKRQLLTLKQGNDIPVVPNLAQREDVGKSRDKAAAKVGMVDHVG